MGESWGRGKGPGEAVLRKTMWLEALESQEEGRPGPPWEPQPRMQPRGFETAAAWEGRD